ncbi:MAG TPA: ribosome small subunit-dependent GTPase A [Firmicutes bacterium]|nr:ribosome small subunit-dependent GTPase A [Bacillota bacterium]
MYTVKDDEGKKYICHLRGRLKQRQMYPLVGDWVLFSPEEKVIEEIKARDNRLLRPPVANIDQVMIVASLTSPEPDWSLVNRQLIAVEQVGLAVYICLNKIDLINPRCREKVDGMLRGFPYSYYFISAALEINLEKIIKLLTGRCTVFAGPSGVGKSTLLNAIQPDLRLKTGDISGKLKLGRHTTRSVELLSLKVGGMVVDTPGFSRLDLPDLKPEQLAACFPEFDLLAQRCFFRNCLHLAEPGCAVREAADQGKVNHLRYKHYHLFLKELISS